MRPKVRLQHKKVQKSDQSVKLDGAQICVGRVQRNDQLGARVARKGFRKNYAMSDSVTDPSALRFAVAGGIPNSRLPLLLYRTAVGTAGSDPAAAFEGRFARHGWVGAWRDGIYDFPHYHTTAHEVLGIARGWARVRFGGEAGETIRVAAGDVAVLPAGTGHERLEGSADLLVVGAYPDGQEADLVRADRQPLTAAAIARIAAVPLPEQDPVRGGPMKAWREGRE